MTEDQKRNEEFFRQFGDAKIELVGTAHPEQITVEELYQHFKVRIVGEIVRSMEEGSADEAG